MNCMAAEVEVAVLYNESAGWRVCTLQPTSPIRGVGCKLADCRGAGRGFETRGGA
jgi:hypothetical protein